MINQNGENTVMDFTLDDLNRYIEVENSKKALMGNYFQTFAVNNFRDTPTDELIASFEVCGYAKAPHVSTNAASYQTFRRLFEDGQIDILQLTGRQRLLLLTCMSDPAFTQRMTANITVNEERLTKLRKALPLVLPVLRNSDFYTAQQFKVAHWIAHIFMECNRKALNYRRYTVFAEQAADKDIP